MTAAGLGRAAFRRPATAMLLSAGAGALSVLAFAPFGLYPLAILCPALLFWLADGLQAQRAALYGALFGIGQFGVGVWWLYIALGGIGGAPAPLALLLLVLLVLLLSFFPALVLALAGRLAPNPGAYRYLLWLPALWTLVEWLRSWIFTGFPWLSLGYSQIDSPLAGYAPVLGVFALSWAVALSAGLLLMLVAAPKRWPLTIGALALLWIAGALLTQVSWTRAIGKPLTVTLAQGDIAQRDKWSPAAVTEALQRYADLTRGHWHSDLIVWPETAIPDYYRAVHADLKPLGKRLAAHQSTLMTGVLRASQDGRKIYNDVIAVGAGQGHYDKRHLVPFGEYFPLPSFVLHWMAALGLPSQSINAGAAQQPLIRADGQALGVSICYEDVFGGLIARDLPAATLLVNVSDDAWFGQSIGPEQHFQMARMRAAETGRYLLRADNSAVTAVVGPRGSVVKRAPGFKPAVISTTVQPMAGATPFVRWHNWGVLGLILLTLASGTVTGAWRRRIR